MIINPQRQTIVQKQNELKFHHGFSMQLFSLDITIFQFTAVLVRFPDAKYLSDLCLKGQKLNYIDEASNVDILVSYFYLFHSF